MMGISRRQSVSAHSSKSSCPVSVCGTGNVRSHVGLLVNSHLSSQTWQLPQSPHCSLLAAPGRDAGPEKLKGRRTGRQRAQQQRREPTNSQQRGGRARSSQKTGSVALSQQSLPPAAASRHSSDGIRAACLGSRLIQGLKTAGGGTEGTNPLFGGRTMRRETEEAPRDLGNGQCPWRGAPTAETNQAPRLRVPPRAAPVWVPG